MQEADGPTGGTTPGGDVPWANSPIAQLLVEGDLIVAANGAAKALLGAAEGLALSAALAMAPLRLRCLEGGWTPLIDASLR